MMNSIDVSKARTSQNKFANGSLTSDRGAKGGLSNAGNSMMGSTYNRNMKSDILGGNRYSKINLSGSFHEASVAFKIGGDSIPEASTIRDGSLQADKMSQLMRVPQHKPVVIRFDGHPGNRTLVPLTNEDLGQFGNLSLIRTLREDVSPNKSKPSETYGSPPSFYEEDQAKWEKKFEKEIAERAVFKKKLTKTIDLNPRNIVNNNVHATSDFFDTERKINDENLYTGGQIKPTKGSEFKRVLMRRKSRLSVASPGNLDIDYRGDSGKFAHLLNKSSNQADLNYSMNLRNYKNDTFYTAKEAFLYPQKKEFRPEQQFENVQATMQVNSRHYFHNKFTDKITKEKNHNALAHMRNTADFSQVNWMTNLCDRRDGMVPPKRVGVVRTIKERYQ